MKKVVSLILGFLVSFFIGWLVGSLNSTFKSVTNDPNAGRFLGKPHTSWLENGRDMELLKDFVFIDSRGKSWLAEKGTTVNGASIPRVFWTMTGGPLTGKFRNASIVHDAECEKMISPSTDVHRMFYDACRAGGVDEREAKYLYWAVANYGPSWDNVVTVSTPILGSMPDQSARLKSQPRIVENIKRSVLEPTYRELEWAKSYFKKFNPPIEQVPFLTMPSTSQQSDAVPIP